MTGRGTIRMAVVAAGRPLHTATSVRVLTPLESYIHEHLIRTSGPTREVYQCCHTGYDRYKRKDGKPLTKQDVQWLRKLDLGQRNVYRGKAGDKEFVHEWTCDSGD